MGRISGQLLKVTYYSISVCSLHAHVFVCVCGALHFGSDTFLGFYCYVSDNFLLPLPVLDVYKYVYINFEEKKDTYRVV